MSGCGAGSVADEQRDGSAPGWDAGTTAEGIDAAEPRWDAACALDAGEGAPDATPGPADAAQTALDAADLSRDAGSGRDAAESGLDAAHAPDASRALDAGGALDASVAAERIYGVTADSIWDPGPLKTSLERLAHRPTVRVVFDEFVPASEYAGPVAQIAPAADILGELLDSSYVWQYSTAEYEARTVEYLDALGSQVDWWEVGNEINGEWLCAQDALSCSAAQTQAVVTKMHSAWSRVKARGARAALTLYYNEDCWASPQNEMFAWAQANVPADMKAGLELVLVSYYEDDCNGLQPDWQAAFDRLGTMFPNSLLAIGECGTTDPAKKAAYIDRYYRMQIAHPRFVLGGFWWYFAQDMVPDTKPLWTTLNEAISSWP